ncbi:lysine-specific demethylase 6B-like isoform X1 [Bubalus bubalis]|uniref:lysine-specific demethylase 6B-like isoform X1 n=1 Tax=Bubalus bubalis TaxID=89462 RepID=UPI001D0FC67E|nr:lysine-specific demethylase 6B-like isoform X1 [Bubalus bubalis]
MGKSYANSALPRANQGSPSARPRDWLARREEGPERPGIPALPIQVHAGLPPARATRAHQHPACSRSALYRRSEHKRVCVCARPAPFDRPIPAPLPGILSQTPAIGKGGGGDCRQQRRLKSPQIKIKINPLSQQECRSGLHAVVPERARAPPGLVVSTARPLSGGVPLWGRRGYEPNRGANGGSASWFSKAEPAGESGEAGRSLAGPQWPSVTPRGSRPELGQQTVVFWTRQPPSHPSPPNFSLCC